jgi:8-oxo-dGTP pyrophosphatase MutT (NUDIX family)
MTMRIPRQPAKTYSRTGARTSVRTRASGTCPVESSRAGESELDALTRELHEELGVQIARRSVSRLCRLTAGPADVPALLSAWLVRDWQGTPANVAPEEHDDIGWFGLEELPPLAHELVRTAVAAELSLGGSRWSSPGPGRATR